MIDYETEIFSTVATALRSAHSGIFVAGEAVAAPSSFPAVTLVEADNAAYMRSMDSSSSENHVSLMYEANIYSNKTSGKKAECKKILATIDAQMQATGFYRVNANPVEVAQANIYRMIARYRAVVSKNGLVFRR